MVAGIVAVVFIGAVWFFVWVLCKAASDHDDYWGDDE